MKNNKAIQQIIKEISGQANVLSIPRVYISVLGTDINSALLLSQCVYWSDRTKRKDGFFYKSYKQWGEEIGLSAYQVKRSTDKLVRLKLIETKTKRANGAPTVHYKVDMEAVTSLIIKFLDNRETSQSETEETSQSDNKETKESITETTTETTTEIKKPSPIGGECVPPPKRR